MVSIFRIKVSSMNSLTARRLLLRRIQAATFDVALLVGRGVSIPLSRVFSGLVKGSINSEESNTYLFWLSR